MFQVKALTHLLTQSYPQLVRVTYIQEHHTNVFNLFLAKQAWEAVCSHTINGIPVEICTNEINNLCGIGNVFVTNLDSSIDTERLQEQFDAYGEILSCKVSAVQYAGFFSPYILI